MVLLHVSDPHFGTERTEVCQALVRLAHQQVPDVVVLSGDITQRAWRRQYAAAGRLMAQLPGHHVVVPGNHDLPLFHLWQRWRRPYANFAQVFGPQREPIHDSANWLVVGVDSTRPWRHKHGQLDDNQVGRVATRLAQADVGQLRVVVAHHPLRASTPADHHNLVRGHAQAAAAWSQAGADLVLGGHVHLPYILPLGQPAPPSQGGGWVVQAGTAVSQRVRGRVPNSVNLIRWAGGNATQCQVERWDHQAKSGEFLPVAHQVLSCNPAGRVLPRS